MLLVATELKVTSQFRLLFSAVLLLRPKLFFLIKKIYVFFLFLKAPN